MKNYFRITAYHPDSNVSAIIDSNGLYDKLWKFSSLLVQKGFQIITVCDTSKFDFGQLPATPSDDEHMIVRACAMGQPLQNGNSISVNGKSYVIL